MQVQMRIKPSLPKDQGKQRCNVSGGVVGSALSLRESREMLGLAHERFSTLAVDLLECGAK